MKTEDMYNSPVPIAFSAGRAATLVPGTAKRGFGFLRYLA